MTKDERFLLEMYRKLETLDDTLDPYQLAKDLGYSERLTQNILRGLCQANFIKKYDEDEVGLTERGIELAKAVQPKQ